MKKRLIPIIIALVYSLNILPAFAEYDVDEVYAEIENNLLTSEEAGIIDISEITEDNVLFQAMQNKQPSQKFGLRKAVRQSADADTTEISADFDIVMNFDMSSDMYDFDVNGDKEWLEDFKAIAEQAPDNTRYAVVSSDTEGFTYDLETSIDDIESNSYTGENDIVAMLDDSAAAFGDDSDNRNKVVIATTQTVDDADELEDKLGELRNDDVIPFVFVLNEETEDALDIDGVYQCATYLELRVAISDLYLSFGEFQSALNSENEHGISVKSDFREDRHRFTSTSADSEGLMMASVLNMYKCVPLIAHVGAKGPKYDLFNDTSETKLRHFVLAENTEFGDVPSEFQESWDEIFLSISSDKQVVPKDKEKYESVISKNMKRRFPILIKNNDSWEIVYEYNGIVDDIFHYNSSKNTELSNITAIFDTYEYILSTVNMATNLFEKVSRTTSEIIIEIQYPNKYDFKINESAKEDNTIRREALDGKTGYINFSSEDKKLFVTAQCTSQNTERNFVVGSQATFMYGVADIYGANKLYYTRYYYDVKSEDWFHDYIFKATNLGIVSGTDENKFEPDKPITIGQLFRMILETAKVAIDENTTDYWAYPYMIKASKLGLVNIEGKNYESIKELGEKTVCRGEAAKYICNMFFEKRDEVNVPTLLYDDVEKIGNYKREAFKFFGINKTTEEGNAIYKLYMNGVMNGYDSQSMGQNDSLTRAQVCTLLIKCLFDMDENIPTIEANIEGQTQTEPISINVTTNEVFIDDIAFNNDNTVSYDINIDDDHVYLIETMGEDLSADNNTTIIAGTLKYNDGPIVTPMRGKQKILSSDNANSPDNRHLLYRVEGHGKYTLTIMRRGTGNINLKITDMENAQMLLFNSTSGQYYIFDDNPEYIRRCDILDDENFEATTLLHQYNLQPGIYNVFVYHHVQLKPRPSEANHFTEYPDSPLYFPDNARLFFDVVFSEGANNVKIRKLGFHAFTDEDIDESGNTKQLGWDCNVKTLEDYENGNSLLALKQEGKLNTDGSFNNSAISQWLSDVTGVKKIKPENTNDYGVVHLLLEFEVSSGTVNFSTVAYKDKSQAKAIFAQKTSEELKGTYAQTKTPEETDTDTLKGIGEDSKTKTASELTYIVDNPATQTLYVDIENQFYEKRRSDCFVTNCNPWVQMDNFSGSSAVNLMYSGKVTTSRNTTTGVGIESEDGVWYFDSVHSRYTQPYSIPEAARFGFYENKETHLVNERFDSQWLYDIPFSEDKNEIKQDYSSISIAFTDYGINYVVPIRIYNSTDKDMYFYYTIDAHHCKTSVDAYDEAGHTVDVNNLDTFEYESGSITSSSLKRQVLLKKGEWTNIEASTVLLTGSNGEIRHQLLVSPE